jgi:hypothetical protein
MNAIHALSQLSYVPNALRLSPKTDSSLPLPAAGVKRRAIACEHDAAG